MALQELLGPSIAAVAALAGVVAGAGIGSRSQERHWIRDAVREGCAEVLRTYAVIHEQLGYWARRGDRPTIDWGEWNRAMGQVRLLATPEVVSAGDAIDTEFWLIDHELKAGRGGLENWLTFQQRLEAKHLDFVNAARKNLQRRSVSLARSVGRPPNDHPMWRTR
ncbi:hypothetical protein ACFY94_11415 [Streptomyces griseorubiginosus]|uniref:hypothetical protein n=1 Tax=Streptomyces griseorubiginosus TaxID=67304 RepID=UPI0036E4646B